jgi:translation initiation factor IF-3
MSVTGNKYLFNFQIKANFVHLIDEKGKSHGITHINDAINMAKNAGLDLVQVSEDASKPTCKIMDFGKFKYDISKQKQVSHHKTKELFITAHIGKHDLDTKLVKLKEFISKKYSVIFGIKFKNNKERKNAESMKEMLFSTLDSVGCNYNPNDVQMAPDKISIYIK